MLLRNKRVLITAGPTWVNIDNVRAITNIATGKTGILLAEKLHRLGAKVTLILGPVQACCINKKIRVISFKFFDELKCALLKELKTGKYDLIIHSAAVSDYRPLKTYRHKLKSGINRLKLELVPTIKIIELIKKIDPRVFAIGFKFQPLAGRDILVKEAAALLRRAKIDLVVANSINKDRYSAYLVDKKKVSGLFSSREKMACGLIKFLHNG